MMLHSRAHRFAIIAVGTYDHQQVLRCALIFVPEGTQLETSQPKPRFYILIALALIAVVPLNMFVPSLPKIAEDYGVEYGVVNIAIGGYAIVMAVTQILGGALSDRYGRRPVALASLAIFTIASIGSMFAPNVTLFLVFRMAQGVVAACQSVAMAAIRDSWQGDEMRSKISSLSSAWAVGPMMGPSLGGILAANFGWRSNFFLFAAMGAIAFTLVFLTMRETNTDKSARLMEASNYTGFTRQPLFWAYGVIMAFTMGLLYVFLGGAPSVAEAFGNLTEFHVGLFIGMLPVGFAIGSQVTARTSKKITGDMAILIGRTITMIGLTTGLILYFAGVNHPLAFFLPTMTIGLGNGFTHPPVNAGVLLLAGKNAGAALGLASAVSVAGAALISSIAGFVIQGENVRLSTLLVLLTIATCALFLSMWILRAGRGSSPARGDTAPA